MVSTLDYCEPGKTVLDFIMEQINRKFNQERIKSMGNAIVTLKKGQGRTIKSGGMWVYGNEIESVMGSFENGDLVEVHDFDGYPMGTGF